jgi:hypothetical protein
MENYLEHQENDLGIDKTSSPSKYPINYPDVHGQKRYCPMPINESAVMEARLLERISRKTSKRKLSLFSKREKGVLFL